jgi:hypothetical protein
MPPPVPTRIAALSGLEDSTRRFTGLLRSVTNPSARAIGHWSIGEVATHTSHIYELFPRLVRGERSPVADHLALDVYWESALKEDTERDPSVAADRVAAAVESLKSALDEHGWNHEVSWHAGLPVPAYALPLILINESALHGLDVARAERRPWAIPREHAVLALQGVLAVAPYFLDKGVAGSMKATYEVRLRGGPTAYFKVSDGELAIDNQRPQRVDCKLSVDPVEYLLVGYGRKGRLGPVARGSIVAYGRKPWLGLKLAKMFHSV